MTMPLQTTQTRKEGLRPLPQRQTSASAKNPPTDSPEALASISLPHTVAEWPRNSRETLRVRLDRYQGTATIDMRGWYADTLGNLLPGRGGLTLSVRHLPALAKAMVKALETAERAGLLEARLDQEVRATAKTCDRNAA